ncbi:excinuclease ABC subunit UvrC [Bacillota bacterium LX-D]|nr:excinuclease ABC subunit UvrC [Bacillota bacterium LX-D]
MAEEKILIEEKLKLLPEKPGVYLMKNEDGEIIYVGKALSLKNRVRSYFRKNLDAGPKVEAMVKRIADLEWIITDSEVEALILECNLIKKHRPKYNIRLADDKHYPYLKLTMQEDFPRLIITRSIQKDGAKYFGPYTRTGAMHEILKLSRKIFPLRTCSNSTFERQSRPCLNAHIKRCLAPCTGQVSKDQYRETAKAASLFLEGKQEDLVKSLQEKMLAAAENLEFEKAAAIRDQLQAIHQAIAKQKIISPEQENQDVIAMARGRGESCLQIFFVREGKLIGREHFMLNGTDGMSRTEVMTAFLKQYYSSAPEIPKEIILQEEVEDEELIATWLSDQRGQKVYLKVPKRGEKLKLVEMVAKNALMSLEEEELTRRRKDMMTKEAVLELQKELYLAKPPFRIECYDISNTQGTNSVGSMVVFENGEPKNSDYRRFQIKTVEGPNDFASMQEVLTRRFKRALAEIEAGEEQGKFSRLPDLIIIDGGKGQLGAAREVMKNLGVSDIPTFGLAKEEELLFSEGRPEPIFLPRNSSALYLVQRIRDEAHRFAISYHRQLRSKRAYQSILNEIPGIGAKRKKALLKYFGSIKKIKEATLEELAQVEGMNYQAAEAVLEYLGKQERS